MAYRKINGEIFEIQKLDTSMLLQRLIAQRDALQVKIDAIQNALNS